MSAPTRAALYARVSTSNNGQDVGLQLDELRQVADMLGLSRTTLRRRLREKAESGEADPEA
jgi:DNA invertase Pin-like site-specific DNA recombinase